MTEPEIIPIEDMDLDVKRAADELFLGPQAQLVEKIQNFNTRYSQYCSSDSIIQINKKYGLKPGTYDKIKEVHANYCLGYRSKPKDMWTLEYRMNRDRWRQRDFWRSAIAIQTDMYSLKHSDAGWQDNVEIVEEFWNDLKERIPGEVQDALSVFTNDNVNIGIQLSNVENSDLWSGIRIIIEVFTSDINMQVIHQEEEIANYSWGNVATKWSIPLWKYINNWCEGGIQSRTNYSINNPKAKIYPKYPKMRHPYISNNNSYTRVEGSWINNTCTGDLQSDLKEAVWSLDINAICALSRSWLSRYHIPRTNPLNRIEHCHYGWEIGMDEKIWKHRDISPEGMMLQCKWPDVFSSLDNNTDDENNACDECQFKEGYAYLIDSTVISDDAAYPGQRVIEVEPCHRAIVEYECLETDEDIIAEACLMHIMCCSVLRNMPTESLEGIDYMLSEQNRFPVDANLETIYRLNPEFNFSNAFRSEQLNWSVRGHIDLLDIVFDTRIWHDLVDEYIELHGLDESDAEDASYDLRNESIERIREMIDRERQRRLTRDTIWPVEEITLEEGTPFDPLTTEEQAIRWATQHGRTINI